MTFQVLLTISKIGTNTEQTSKLVYTATFFQQYSPNFTASLISLIIHIYFLVCVDSLYRKFKDEYFSVHSSRISHPVPYVVDYQSSPYNPYIEPQSTQQQIHMYPQAPTKYWKLWKLLCVVIQLASNVTWKLFQIEYKRMFGEHFDLLHNKLITMFHITFQILLNFPPLLHKINIYFNKALQIVKLLL